MIELSMITGLFEPPDKCRPPPEPPPPAPSLVKLPENVELLMVTTPPFAVPIAPPVPPAPVTELPVKVQPVMVSDPPPSIQIAPPFKPSELFVKLQLVRVTF